MNEPRRRYSSQVRQESARLTQQRILDAAEQLFSRDGYAATTMAAIAAAAGVTAQTVYNAIGGKPMVLKRLYDVRLAGDTDSIPMADRPEFDAVRAATDSRDLLTAYARVGLVVIGRVGHIARMVADGAAAGDEELRAVRDTTDRERRVGAGNVATRLAENGSLRADVSLQQATDVVWSLNSLEMWRLLVADSGWTPDAYARWIAEAAAATLLR